MALGFIKKAGRPGDHDYYEKGKYLVQIDTGEKHGFGTPGMKIIIDKTGYSAEIFYRATKETAKKINKKPLTKKELEELDS